MEGTGEDSANRGLFWDLSLPSDRKTGCHVRWDLLDDSPLEHCPDYYLVSERTCISTERASKLFANEGGGRITPHTIYGACSTALGWLNLLESKSWSVRR